MDLGEEVRLLNCWIAHIGNLGLYLLWQFVHILVTLWYIMSGIVKSLQSYLISSGLIKRYHALDINKLRYLAIVMESEEARETSKVVQLLLWLTNIGVREACLFDPQGVLKKSKDLILQGVPGSTQIEEVGEKDSLPDQGRITLEFISSSDSKEAVAKAANILFRMYMKSNDPGNTKGDHFITEANLNEALKAVGGSGHEPNLLLVYGPVRCHRGFPAWRLRYTEIAHMGSLKYMKYGSLVKEIYRFTGVIQNYGV